MLQDPIRVTDTAHLENYNIIKITILLRSLGHLFNPKGLQIGFVRIGSY